MVSEASDQPATEQVRDHVGRILSTTARHKSKTVTYTQRELVDGTIAYYRSGRRLTDGRSINAAQHHLRKAVSTEDVDARPVHKRTVKFEGRQITYTERVLKDGTVAYYRGHRRVKSRRLIGIAKEVLAGRGVAQARRQHPTPSQRAARRFNQKVGDKTPGSARAIEQVGVPHIERWGAPVRSLKPRQKRTFYVLVEVVAFRGGPGSHVDLHFDDPDDIDKTRTHPATIAIRGPDGQGLTKAQFQRDYEGHVREQLDRHGLLLPADQDVQDATIAIWRSKQ